MWCIDKHKENAWRYRSKVCVALIYRLHGAEFLGIRMVLSCFHMQMPLSGNFKLPPVNAYLTSSQTTGSYLYIILPYVKPWPVYKLCQQTTVYDERYPFVLSVSFVAEITQFSEMMNCSRCVLAVLDESFLVDENVKFCLKSAPPEIDVVYVVYDIDLDEFQTAYNGENQLGPALITHFRNQRDAGGVVEWPKQKDGKIVVLGRSRATSEFWRRVRLAIPRRKKVRAVNEQRTNVDVWSTSEAWQYIITPKAKLENMHLEPTICTETFI